MTITMLWLLGAAVLVTLPTLTRTNWAALGLRDLLGDCVAHRGLALDSPGAWARGAQRLPRYLLRLLAPVLAVALAVVVASPQVSADDGGGIGSTGTMPLFGSTQAGAMSSLADTTSLNNLASGNVGPDTSAMLATTSPTAMIDPAGGAMASDAANMFSQFSPTSSAGFAGEMAANASPVMAMFDSLANDTQRQLQEAMDRDRLQRMMQRNGPRSADKCPTSVPDAFNPNNVDVHALCAKSVEQARSDTAAAAIVFAMNQIGHPYCRGDTAANPLCNGDRNRFGEGPAQGFDCSGLVTRAYREAGFDLAGADWTGVMATARWSVNLSGPSEILPGDLYLRIGSGNANSDGHVGIALADGYIVHAASSDSGVRVQKVWDDFNHWVAVNVDS